MNKYIYRDGKEFEVVKLVHLTTANSSRRARDGKSWKTIAVLKDTYNGVTAQGISWCSKRDQPNRKLGREVAFGRAARKLQPLR